MKRESNVIMMWQIVEPNGETMNFLTVQDKIAEALCRAVEGRKMQKVAIAVSDEQYREYLRNMKYYKNNE